MRSPSRNGVHAAVERAIKTWVAQKTLLFTGKEGFPARAVLGKIRDEAEGAAQPGVAKQKFPEVYRGDGLDVQIIMQFLEGIERAVLFCHYAFHFKGHCPISIDEQCRYLGISKPIYLDKLHSAVGSISTGLQVLEMCKGWTSTPTAANF